MRRKIYIGLITYVLALTFFAFIGEVNAQKKPNAHAKNLAAQGGKFYDQKDYRSAIDKYAEAIAVAPNYPLAHYYKGYAHHRLDEYDAAIEDLDAALKQGYEPIRVYEVRWEAHYKKKNYDAALSDVEQALRIEPSNNYFILALGDVHRLKGEYQEAITAYNKGLPGSRNSGDIHYYIAASHFKLNEPSQQNLAANEAIKNNTRYTGESYLLMADALVKSKKPTEAILAYERALNVKPENPAEVYTALSNLYQSQSRLRDAIATIRKGIELHPDNGDMLIALTLYYSLADRYAAAVDVGQKAVKLSPNNHVAHTNLCRAYNDIKDYPRAVMACNKALALKPNDGETFFYLARAHDLQNKPEVATQYYKKAVSGLVEYTGKNPDFSDGWYLLGNAYYTDQQVDKAIEAYQRSLQLNPNFAKARLNLGYMYVANKNLPMAREQYDILLKIDPPSAEKLKERMEKK